MGIGDSLLEKGLKWLENPGEKAANPAAPADQKAPLSGR